MFNVYILDFLLEVTDLFEIGVFLLVEFFLVVFSHLRNNFFILLLNFLNFQFEISRYRFFALGLLSWFGRFFFFGWRSVGFFVFCLLLDLNLLIKGLNFVHLCRIVLSWYNIRHLWFIIGRLRVLNWSCCHLFLFLLICLPISFFNISLSFFFFDFRTIFLSRFVLGKFSLSFIFLRSLNFFIGTVFHERNYIV